MQVSWDEVPQIDQNGIITIYEILYEPQETFGGVIMSMQTNVSGTSLLLSGLEEFVVYSVSVRAYTRLGPGPYSETIFGQTLNNCELHSAH